MSKAMKVHKPRFDFAKSVTRGQAVKLARRFDYAEVHLAKREKSNKGETK